MRKAFDRLGAFYQTQLGQDVLETAVGAGTAAAGQLLFTDMTPEEIAVSTMLGVGAAAVGRPVVGRLGQAIGTRLDAQSPSAERFSRQVVHDTLNSPLGPEVSAMMQAKFAPYAHLSPSAQLGQIFGRGYGDNVAQALVALGAPLVISDEEK